ncbi:hypothetical protein [Anaerovibrio lipolyticus]|uniref:hypothetical protein n=1 Tax=Anaerovibrio lipolyticus TaxID=82374 RepID=UPI0026E9B050|nr:hypothetical protein [Anaerovibrio lipolyticus]MBE6105312.1 hypothetical protein [Anaerovibrio lipolyticus]
MYQTTIASVNGNMAADIKGRSFYIAGSSMVTPGQQVWTDGKIIYGNTFIGSQSYIPTPTNGGIIWLIPNKSIWYTDTKLKPFTKLCDTEAKYITCGNKSQFYINQGNWTNGQNQNTIQTPQNWHIKDACFIDNTSLFEVGHTCKNLYYPQGLRKKSNSYRMGYYAVCTAVLDDFSETVKKYYSNGVNHEMYIFHYEGFEKAQNTGGIYVKKDGDNIDNINLDSYIDKVNQKALTAVNSLNGFDHEHIQSIAKINNMSCHPDGSYQIDFWVGSFHTVFINSWNSFDYRFCNMVSVISEARYIVTNEKEKIIYSNTRAKVIKTPMPNCNHTPTEEEQPENQDDFIAFEYGNGLFKGVDCYMNSPAIRSSDKPIWVTIEDPELKLMTYTYGNPTSTKVRNFTYKPKHEYKSNWWACVNSQKIMDKLLKDEHWIYNVVLVPWPVSPENQDDGQDTRPLQFIKGAFWQQLEDYYGKEQAEAILDNIVTEAVIEDYSCESYEWKLDETTATYSADNQYYFKTTIEGCTFTDSRYITDAYKIKKGCWLFSTLQTLGNIENEFYRIELIYWDGKNKKTLQSMLVDEYQGRNTRIKNMKDLKKIKQLAGVENG